MPMRSARRIILLACLAGLVLPTAAPAAKLPRVKARLTACQAALTPLERFGTFEGEMRAIPGAARMQMRFVLQTRTLDKPRWSALAAEGFGVWTTSDPGVGRYVYTKKVANLVAPADYRVLVRFRWLDGNGRRLASARRTTPFCRQPDLRPNIVPVRIEIARGEGDATRYVVVVRNRGRTPAGPFGLVLTVNGTALPAESVLGLAAGQRRFVAISGPACEPGSTLSVAVDPEGRVDERDEGDNALAVPCPAPAPAGRRG
jgi:hypothetical protein